MEECDDGNIYNNDGCDSNCQLEIDWLCSISNISYSECTYNKQPKF